VDGEELEDSRAELRIDGERTRARGRGVRFGLGTSTRHQNGELGHFCSGVSCPGG